MANRATRGVVIRSTIAHARRRRSSQLALLAAAVLLIGACNTAPSPTPAASPSTPAPSSAAPSSPAASAPASPLACAGPDLRATGGPWGGAAGSRGSDVVVENQGTADCLLPAGPTIAIVDAGGTVLATTPARAGSGPSLGPGGTARFSVVFGNWCTQGTSLPLRFKLALAGDAIDIGNLVVASADELPPCNGPGLPPSLSATDWQP